MDKRYEHKPADFARLTNIGIKPNLQCCLQSQMYTINFYHPQRGNYANVE